MGRKYIQHDWKNHKYVNKIKLPNGKYRYIYDNTYDEDEPLEPSWFEYNPRNKEKVELYINKNYFKELVQYIKDKFRYEINRGKRFVDDIVNGNASLKWYEDRDE